MSDARNAIFAKIRKAEAGRTACDPAEAKARLQTPTPQPVPAIAQPSPDTLTEAFIAKAMELGCTTADCPNMDAVPNAVKTYLTEQKQSPDVTVPESCELSNLDWAGSGMTASRDLSREALDGRTGITRALAGVAETGAVAVAASDTYPVSLGLLPDRHIIVLTTDELVGGYEDVWRQARAARDNQGMARSLIFVGGPSRTADIEATLVMGAHGPRAVHIILVSA